MLDGSVDRALDLDPAFESGAPELDATVPDAFNLLPDADLETPVELVGRAAESSYVDDFDIGDSPLDSAGGTTLDFIPTAGTAGPAAVAELDR